jgi:ATP-dependent RNA helicase DDX47/RRP3
MSFGELGIEKSLIDILAAKGIKEPAEIQKKAIPIIFAGRDLIGASKTGSGKTLAFVLPLITNLLVKGRTFYCLVLTPTRELALQIVECLGIFESTGLRACALVGGESFGMQANRLSKQPHFIVGTPGRVAEHLCKTKPLRAQKIRKLVLDEADRFFEEDFAGDLDIILGKLREKKQVLLFTATVTDKVARLSGLVTKNPRTVEIAPKYETVTTLSDFYLFVPMRYKHAMLYAILKDKRDVSAMVFVSTCSSTVELSLALGNLGTCAEALHGSLVQAEREYVMDRFRNSDFNVLVCTDLGSRGLDITHVTHVINFDVPSQAKDYVHRVGRTARAGKTGDAITFITQYDVEQMQRIEFVIGRKLQRYGLEEGYRAASEKVEAAIEEARALMRERREGKKRKLRA